VDQAKKGLPQLYLHALHLGEIYYITLREQGKDVADLAYTRIKRFPIRFVETINEELLLTAAALKANYSFSYAVSFAAALAKVKNALLLTGDPAFPQPRDLLNGVKNISLDTRCLFGGIDLEYKRIHS
jgi:predicted nucleic acid-binding protein